MRVQAPISAMPALRRALAAAGVAFEPLELTPQGVWRLLVFAPRSPALLAAVAAAGAEVLDG